MNQAEKVANIQNMNMNMGGMVGGPIHLNNGQIPQQVQQGQTRPPSEKALLNTYIYDYLLKNEMYACAKAILDETEVMTMPNSQRGSPSRRAQKDGDGNLINGIEDHMDTDGPGNSGDGEGGNRKGDDLPLAKVPMDCPQSSFLYDWWCLFWDIFGARSNKSQNMNAMQYVQHTQANQRMRQVQEQQILRQIGPQGQMMPGRVMPNGVVAMGQDSSAMNDMAMQKNQQLARTAMINRQKSTPQQLAQMKNGQQMLQQQSMQGRSDSEMADVNGQGRPQSPAMQNAASPSNKRQRLSQDGEYQNVSNGRGQPVGNTANPASSQQATNLLISHGINPNQLSAAQFASFTNANSATQAKSIQVYAQNLANHHQQRSATGMVPKGLPNAQAPPVNHGSPMMQQVSEGGMNDIYNTQAGRQPMPNAGSNHALQDYQMQLMLLEQQNKKRLLMARAEQDNLTMQDRPRGDQPGTPKMGTAAGPGSPLPADLQNQMVQRNSPASIAAFNGQVPGDNPQFMFNQMNQMNQQGGSANGQMMRPPGAGMPGFPGQMNPQMAEAMNPAMRQQVGRGQPNGQMWPQGQGMPGAPGQGQAPNQQMKTNAQGQPNPANQQNRPNQAMPPPSAPAPNGRAPSPNAAAQPPTPTPTNKAGPKRKETKETRKGSVSRPKAGKAAGAAGATPSEPPTPTTPITPHPPKPFPPGQAGPAGQGNFPAQAAPASGAPVAQAPDATSQQFTDMSDTFNFDMGADSDALLDTFDFDSFLNTDDQSGGGINFDHSLGIFPGSELEAGGDQ